MRVIVAATEVDNPPHVSRAPADAHGGLTLVQYMLQSSTEFNFEAVVFFSSYDMPCAL